MLNPLRIPRKWRQANWATKFVFIEWRATRHEISSRPQPVACRTLHLVRGLVAEARQFVGHFIFLF